MQLQVSLDKINYNPEKEKWNINHTFLVIKVISTGILMLISSGKAESWTESLGNPSKNILYHKSANEYKTSLNIY